MIVSLGYSGSNFVLVVSLNRGKVFTASWYTLSRRSSYTNIGTSRRKEKKYIFFVTMQTADTQQIAAMNLEDSK